MHNFVTLAPVVENRTLDFYETCACKCGQASPDLASREMSQQLKDIHGNEIKIDPNHHICHCDKHVLL
uniref:Uncharacterized protein n=1 Tax=Arundo donax TaxID=35708 RepID=A0A0A9CCD7_ARUDO